MRRDDNVSPSVSGCGRGGFAQTPPRSRHRRPPQGGQARDEAAGGAAAHAARSESEFAIPAGTGLDAAGRRAEGRDPRAVHSAEQGLSGHAAHLLGLRAGAVRSGGSGEPDDLPGRAGVQGRERRSARAERDGQPDLPARDSGDDRRVHQSRPHAGAAGTDSADRVGATAPPTAAPSTTRPTTSTRA